MCWREGIRNVLKQPCNSYNIINPWIHGSSSKNIIDFISNKTSSITRNFIINKKSPNPHLQFVSLPFNITRREKKHSANRNSAIQKHFFCKNQNNYCYYTVGEGVNNREGQQKNCSDNINYTYKSNKTREKKYKRKTESIPYWLEFTEWKEQVLTHSLYSFLLVLIIAIILYSILLPETFTLKEFIKQKLPFNVVWMTNFHWIFVISLILSKLFSAMNAVIVWVLGRKIPLWIYDKQCNCLIQTRTGIYWGIWVLVSESILPFLWFVPIKIILSISSVNWMIVILNIIVSWIIISFINEGYTVADDSWSNPEFIQAYKIW